MSDTKRYTSAEVADFIGALKDTERPSSDLTLRQMLQGDLGIIFGEKTKEGWSVEDCMVWLDEYFPGHDIGQSELTMLISSSMPNKDKDNAQES